MRVQADKRCKSALERALTAGSSSSRADSIESGISTDCSVNSTPRPAPTVSVTSLPEGGLPARGSPGPKTRADSLATVLLGAASSSQRLALKVQLHISIAPENEPLPEPAVEWQSLIGAVGEQLQHGLALARQSSNSRRRALLKALHKAPPGACNEPAAVKRESFKRTAGHRRRNSNSFSFGVSLAPESLQEPAEAPVSPRQLTSCSRSLQSLSGSQQSLGLSPAFAASGSGASASAGPAGPEHAQIFFKRDGQRFAHEFTLKLAVGRAHRCLLRLRPPVPVRAISVSGLSLKFTDCSASALTARAEPPAARAARHGRLASYAAAPAESLEHAGAARRLCRSQQSGDELGAQQVHQRALLSRQFAHFAPANAGAGQLVYVFDWPPCGSDRTRDKARTEVNIVLELAAGQTLALPLQVKFYEQNCRQHLSWGSQLHFIDFDCALGAAAAVERVQYY